MRRQRRPERTGTSFFGKAIRINRLPGDLSNELQIKKGVFKHSYEDVSPALAKLWRGSLSINSNC